MFTAGYYDFLRNLIGLKPLTPGSTPADLAVVNQNNNKNGRQKFKQSVGPWPATSSQARSLLWPGVIFSEP